MAILGCSIGMFLAMTAGSLVWFAVIVMQTPAGIPPEKFPLYFAIGFFTIAMISWTTFAMIKQRFARRHRNGV